MCVCVHIYMSNVYDTCVCRKLAKPVAAVPDKLFRFVLEYEELCCWAVSSMVMPDEGF